MIHRCTKNLAFAEVVLTNIYYILYSIVYSTTMKYNEPIFHHPKKIFSFTNLILQRQPFYSLDNARINIPITSGYNPRAFQ